MVPDLSTPLDFTTATFPIADNSGRLFLDGRQGFNHQWNFTFENEFRPGWIYSAGYVGNRGVDLWGQTFWNTPLPRDANDSNDQENTASRRPLQEYRYREQSPQLGHTRSEYHAAQFQLLARTDHLNVIAHYTLSRARAHIDSQFRNRTRSHPFDLERDWASPMYDRPHNLLIMPSYDLPFMRGRRDVVGSVLGGWNATFIFNIQSGQPVNFSAPNRAFQGRSLATRPNETGQAIINDNWRQDPDLIYVNPGSVEQPTDGTFGNASRNAVRWTSPTNTDLTLTKRFYLHGEDVKFDPQVRLLQPVQPQQLGGPRWSRRLHSQPGRGRPLLDEEQVDASRAHHPDRWTHRVLVRSFVVSSKGGSATAAEPPSW